MLFEVLSAAPSINLVEAINRSNRSFDVAHRETADSILHDLGYGAVREGNHRSATCHGFNHDQSEWFWPVYGKEKRKGVA
jgi:hypothetical protein